MKIGIKLSNKEIARDIARRISELYSGIYIVIKDINDDADDVEILIDDLCDIGLPVSILIRDKLLEYEERSGKKLHRLNKFKKETVFVTSRFGGSGVSAISTVLGRIFAGNEGRTVLIVENGDMDSTSYSEPVHLPERGLRELEFLIAKERKICFSRYYYRDRYGPFFITCNVSIGEMMKLIEETNDFDIVIFSGFGYREAPAGAYVINVGSLADRRSESNFVDEKAINVLNRSAKNEVAGSSVNIADDDSSFIVTEGRLVIKMDGDFAKGTENIYLRLRGLI